jgi:hypothetical protein
MRLPIESAHLARALVQMPEEGYIGCGLPFEDRPRMLNIAKLFKGRHFDREIIVLCVRWYLWFKLSSRDLVEMMAERGISLVHTTIMRWVQRYVPEFEKRWNRFACRAGNSWRVDGTYVKIKGRWTYLYRAVDKQGRTVDFLPRTKRDVAAVKAFFRRAFKSQGRLPEKITLDGYSGIPPGGAGSPWRTPERQTNQNPVVEIFEQFDRAGPPIYQAPFGSHAWFEALSKRLNHHHRDRIDA